MSDDRLILSFYDSALKRKGEGFFSVYKGKPT